MFRRSVNDPRIETSTPGPRVPVSRLGVRSWLVLLVVVPFVVLTVVVTSVAWSLHTRNEQSLQIELLAGRLSAAVDAEAAVRAESRDLRTGPEADRTDPPPGAPTGLAPDAALRLRGAAAVTDRALAAAGADADGIDRTLLASLRASALGSPAEPPVGPDALPRLLDQAGAPTMRLTAELERSTPDSIGWARLREGVAGITGVRDLARALGAEFTAVQVFLTATDRSGPLKDLVAVHARRQAIAEALDRIRDPRVAAEWSALKASRPAQLVDSGYTTLTSRPIPPASGAPVTPARSQRREQGADIAYSYQDGVYRLMAAATASVRESADDLHHETSSQMWAWIVLTAGAGGLTGMLSIFSARAVLRPMRRLTDQAAAVARGDLSFDPGRSPVPCEVAVTFGAMADLVDNLRLLEAKTQALAAYDLESPALAEPMSGELGRSLERSAQVLSGSLVELDRLRAQFVHQASHDLLTGLHNRAAAGEALRSALMRASHHGRGVAVSVIDLDGFRRINDSYGHEIGDLVLRTQAERVARILAGDAAFVARLGSDEFAVIHEDVDDPMTVTDVAHRLIDSLAEPILVDEHTVTMSASVGIAFATGDEKDADQVLGWADLAAGRAKASRGSAVELFDQGLQSQLRRHVAIEHALRTALDTQGLFLLYQPVIDLATMRPASVEALVRWDRPGHGIQPPDTFIPVAEASDLIIGLDEWVAGQAVVQLNAWQRPSPLADLDVAVNVSGRHLLSGRVHHHVAELLRRSGTDPRRLIVEITETVLLDDMDRAAVELAELRKLGVRIAIDDFGTGFTSITHLQQLPVDIIKIDRSFVQRLHHERDRSLCALITGIAHQLGAITVAEGIETVEQLDAVRAVGCDHAQGYFFARPLPVQELAAWVHACDPAEAGQVR